MAPYTRHHQPSQKITPHLLVGETLYGCFVIIAVYVWLFYVSVYQRMSRAITFYLSNCLQSIHTFPPGLLVLGRERRGLAS